MLRKESSAAYGTDGRGYETWARNLEATLRGPPPIGDPSVREFRRHRFTHFAPWEFFAVERRAVMVTEPLWDKMAPDGYRVRKLPISSDFLLLFEGDDDWIDVERLGMAREGDEKDMVGFWKYSVPTSPPLPASRVGLSIGRPLLRQPLTQLAARNCRAIQLEATRTVASMKWRWRQEGAETAARGRDRLRGED